MKSPFRLPRPRSHARADARRARARDARNARRREARALARAQGVTSRGTPLMVKKTEEERREHKKKADRDRLAKKRERKALAFEVA